MATTTARPNPWAHPHGKRAEEINSASVLKVLETALPPSIIQLLSTNEASGERVIANDITESARPAWVNSLPLSVEGWLATAVGLEAVSTIVVPAPAPSSAAPPAPSSNPPPPPSSEAPAQSSQQVTIPVPTSSDQPQSSHQPSTGFGPVVVSSSDQPSSMSSGFVTSNGPSGTTTGSVTAPNLFSSTGSTTISPTGGHSSSTPTGAIAGGVVGGVAGLALIGAGAYFLMRRRKNKQRVAPMSEVSINPSDTQYHSGTEYSWR